MKRAFFVVIFLIFTQLSAQNVKRPDTYYYNRGLECLTEGKYRDAYDYFQNELSDNSNNGYAHVWIGYIYLYNDFYGDALESLEMAEKLIPKNDSEYVAFIHSTRGEVYEAMDDYDNALKSFSKAIKTNPTSADLWERRGQLYYDMKQYDLADKDYEKIIELNPSGVMGYMGKGRNALRQGKYEESIALFDKVAKLHGKDYSSCYSFRAEAYAGLKQYEKAADDIITALSIDGDNKAFNLLYYVMAHSAPDITSSKLKIQQLKEPNRSSWPYYSGVVNEEIKNYEKAIEYYQKSNELNTSAMTFSRIATCYSLLGDYLKAINHIDQALQLDPDYIYYRMDKANYEYEAMMTEEAFADIDACIAETPDYYYFHYRKGFFEDNLNMIDEAIEDYTSSILLNPDYAYAYMARGDMYTRKGQTELAVEDYQKAIEIDTIPEVGSCAQFAYLSLGETDKAKEYAQRVIDSSPDDDGVYYNAACLYARMGNTSQAIQYLRTAFEKGYRRFAHIERDDDLDPVRNTKEFKELIKEYKSRLVTDTTADVALAEEVTVEIPFKRVNGVTEVQCVINGLPLHFVFDTGASDVTMSMVEATFMLKNKYLSPLDIVGKQNYLTADGNVSEGTVINLKSVKIGELELTNVRATVVKSQNAPLLLGQSVLGRLGKIEIDNGKRVIRVTGR